MGSNITLNVDELRGRLKTAGWILSICWLFIIGGFLWGEVSFYKKTITVEKYHYFVMAGVHFFIFLVGIFGIFCAFVGIDRSLKKRVATERALGKNLNYLKTLFNTADNVAFVTTDLGGENTKITGFSPGAEKIFGYAADEIIGEDVKILHLPGSEKKFPEMQQVAGKSEKTCTQEVVLLRKSGEQFQALFTLGLYYDSDGKVAGAVGVTVDISKRKKIEQSLQQSEETARALLNAVTESAFLLKLDGTLITMNKLTAERLGQSVDKLVGNCVYDFLPEELAASRKNKIESVKKTKLPCRFFDERDGMIFDHNFYPLFDPDGNVNQLAIFSRDITKERQAEEALWVTKRKFQNMFLQAPVSYQSLDGNGNFSEVNATWLNTMGYAREEVIGRNFSDFLVPEWKEHFAVNFPRFKAVGEVLGVEFEMVKKDGATILVSFHGKIGTGVDGRFERTHCVLNDITLQRSAEETLLNDLELNKSIADISKELLSEEYNIQKVADVVLSAARSLTHSEHGLASSIDKETKGNIGHTLTAMFGDQCKIKDKKIIFPIGEDHTYAGLLGHALNTREPFFTNNPSKHPHSKGLPPGHIELENYLAVPVMAGNNLLGLIALGNSEKNFSEKDIATVERLAEVFALAIHRQEYETHRVEMEKNLRQLQKNEAIGALAGGIAHDFNNILTPLIGYTDFLKEDLGKDSPLLENVYQIHAAAGRAKELVLQILTFSRHHEQEVVPLKPHLVIKEVVKLTKATLPSTIEVHHKIDANCSTIMADPTQVHQVAMNLLTNAYHAMEGISGVLSISLSNFYLEEDQSIAGLDAGPYVVLTVEDTGHGMDNTTADKIFDPYFTTKSQGKGTGLGLSVVYGIVKKYKGNIQVESSLGKGTRFQVYLPAVQQKFDVNEYEQQQHKMHGNESILLVDDEVAILDMEKLQLERLGYTVTIFNDSTEALEEVVSSPGKYDLLITDMTMPQITGDFLTREIRKTNPQLPIIICTGFSESMTPERAASIGANDLLMKPVSGLEMATTVRKLLDC